MEDIPFPIEPDDLVTWVEARAALVAAGFPSTDLRKRRARGNGPEPHKVGHKGVHTVWKWGDVLAWAEANREAPRRGKGVSQIPLGDTALGCWLGEHRETVWAFSRRLGLYQSWVHRLIGHRNSQWLDRMPPDDGIELISLETGIPVGRLVEDAIAAGGKTNGQS
jgi:hypothetical protein